MTSYPARRRYSPYVVFPPEVPGVAGTIDIHAHAHRGQQDALALAKFASQSGMRGILFKTIGSPFNPQGGPMDDVRAVREALHRWADETGVEPIECWAGYGVTRDNKLPTAEKIRAQLEDGVTGIWLPVANHANTYRIVGGRPSWWDPTEDPKAHTEPLPWEEALRVGFYMLDERGALRSEFAEAIRLVAEYDRALFFGHATREEIWVVAEFIDGLGLKRAVIDHPFSPFVDLTVEEMRQLAARGIYLNFTFDELSPLLGIDPKEMYEAIRAVGVEHFTLSSDAGEPLFPNSVESMRLIRGYMQAFGMNEAELETMCVGNPAKIVGLVTASVA